MMILSASKRKGRDYELLAQETHLVAKEEMQERCMASRQAKNDETNCFYFHQARLDWDRWKRCERSDGLRSRSDSLHVGRQTGRHDRGLISAIGVQVHE